MKWEVFDGGPTPRPNEKMHVSINYKNIILLNARTLELLGFPEAVMLLFDREKNVIGLNPASASQANTFRLIDNSRSGRQRVIRASPFCRFFGIRIDNTQVFLQPEIDEDGILRLDLGGMTRSRISNRIIRRVERRRG